MASQNKFAFVAAVVVLLFLAAIGGGDAQTNTICNVPLDGLMACRPAVTKPNPTLPSKTCCASLVNADMKCLCKYKNSNMLPSLGIDPTLAFQLPAKCKLPTLAKCS